MARSDAERQRARRERERLHEHHCTGGNLPSWVLEAWINGGLLTDERSHNPADVWAVIRLVCEADAEQIKKMSRCDAITARARIARSKDWRKRREQNLLFRLWRWTFAGLAPQRRRAGDGVFARLPPSRSGAVVLR